MKAFIFLLFSFLAGVYFPSMLREPVAPATVFVGELRVIENYEMNLLKKREQAEVSRGALRTLQMEVTAYSEHYESCGKHPGEEGYGITASNKRIREGMIAAPPSIPFGTKVYIEGMGVYTVEDRGGAITEGHLDVYMTTHKEALIFGRQKRKVTFL